MGEITLFKHKEYFDYQVQDARSQNCVLVNAEKWLVNDSNAILGVDSRGGVAENSITEVLDENISKNDPCYGELKVGDYVMLSKLATKLYCAKSYTIPVNYDSTKYTDIPVSHVLGVFDNQNISFPSFRMLGNKVLLKRLSDVDIVGELKVTTETTKTVYEVVKVGPLVSNVIEGQIILLRDNVAVETYLNDEQYFAVEEETIVGYFNSSTYNLEDLTPINNVILMKEYIPEKAVGSETILAPVYDKKKDVDGLSQINTEETYRVILSDDNSVDKNDIVYISRYALEYVTFRGTRYYVAFNTDNILATIKE